MKKSADPRHKHRQHLLKWLFAYSFNPRPDQTPEAILPIVNNLPEIDHSISLSASEWPVNQINRVDLAVLRLAIHELNHTHTPPKVIIDEAIELGKEFGSNSSAKFINGVLGNILKQLKKDPETDESA